MGVAIAWYTKALNTAKPWDLQALSQTRFGDTGLTWKSPLVLTPSYTGMQNINSPAICQYKLHSTIVYISLHLSSSAIIIFDLGPSRFSHCPQRW